MHESNFPGSLLCIFYSFFVLFFFQKFFFETLHRLALYWRLWIPDRESYKKSAGNGGFGGAGCPTGSRRDVLIT